MIRRILLGLPLCCFPWLGCTYYDASLLDPQGGAVADAANDAGSDAPVDVASETGSDAGGDVNGDTNGDASEDSSDAPIDAAEDVVEAMTCGHALPPEPSSVSDAGGDIEFMSAVVDIDFGDKEGSPGEVGYDLDSRCTCQGEGNACLRESWATADACDGPEGRDNATGAFIAKLSAATFGDFSSQSFSDDAVNGDWSLLLRIRGYNGLPDDDRVRLDWYVTEQYWEDKPDDSYVPAWDGTDTWPLRASALVDLGGGTYSVDSPKYYDEHAYVAGGVLVGSLAETELQVSADYAIQFKGAFITAKIVNGPLGWVLQDGLLAARWTIDNMLSQVSRLNLLGIPVCKNHPAYLGLKQMICSYADMYSGVGAPTTPCDAVSTGMAFETIPALFGEIIVDELSPAICEPANDPAFDSCSTL